MPTKSLKNSINDTLPSPVLTISLLIMMLASLDVKAPPSDVKLLEHRHNPPYLYFRSQHLLLFLLLSLSFSDSFL
jgi:hypothetical protein